MPDAYKSQAQADRDWQVLDLARIDLDISPSRLRLDECRLWHIYGRDHNTITTLGDGLTFLLYIERHSPRAWTGTKDKLSFMNVRLDGDLDGILSFRLPVSDDEARAIREAGGFRIATTMPEHRRAAAAERLRALHRQAKA